MGATLIYVQVPEFLWLWPSYITQPTFKCLPPKMLATWDDPARPGASSSPDCSVRRLHGFDSLWKGPHREKLHWTPASQKEDLHSRKLTWNLKMMVSNRNLLFQVSIFGCHVSFRECIWSMFEFDVLVIVKYLPMKLYQNLPHFVARRWVSVESNSPRTCW